MLVAEQAFEFFDEVFAQDMLHLVHGPVDMSGCDIRVGDEVLLPKAMVPADALSVCSAAIGQLETVWP